MSHNFGVMCRVHRAVMEPEWCPERGCPGGHGYTFAPCDVRCPDRPAINEVAYRRETGKTHLPDPYLPDPIHEWTRDPWGWEVYTLCGLVLRDSQPVSFATNPCGKCAQRATTRLS